MEQITATSLPQFLPNAELLQFVPTSKLALNGKPQIYFRIPPKYTCSFAAKNGHLDVLKWLRSQDPPCPWSEYTCTHTAQNGHLEVLKWLRAQNPPCPWDKYTCAYAAKNGQLEVLKWLRSQDPPCPWDKWTCTWAAKNGDLEVLKWLRSHVHGINGRVPMPPRMVIWRC
jgi:hypothetical protein